MEHKKEYYAFISYKREDEKWAKWLQNKLEHYKFPTNLNGRTDLPKNIRPTFRDVTDLTPGLLAEEIDKALRSSEWLIVICSPRSAKSPWVCKEAQTFIDLGRADHIIPFVIEGNPFSKDSSTECYPEALLDLTDGKELLAANINEMGRDAAAIKVVARMFNLRFDTLWQRFERERQTHRRWIVGILSLCILAALAIICIIGYQYREILISQSRAVAYRAIEQADQGDSYLAQRLLIEVLPNHKQLLSRPYTYEAEKALRYVSEIISANFASDYIAYPHAVKFSPDGNYIMCISEVNTIVILDYKTLKEVRTITELEDIYISDVSFSPNGQYIVSGSDDNAVRIWDINSGLCVKTMYGHESDITSVSFSQDGNSIISSSYDNTIRIWDVNSGDAINVLVGHESVVTCASLSPDGKFIVSSAWDGTIRIWDIRSGETIRIFTIPHDIVSYATFSPDGKSVAFAAQDCIVKIWDIDSNEVHTMLSSHLDHINYISFSKSGKYLASASSDNTVKIWDVRERICINTIGGFLREVNSVEFSPDDQFIVSASADRISLRNFKDSVHCIILKGHTQDIISTSFSRDENRLVSSSKDNTIRVWNISTGENIRIIDCFRDKVCDVSFSPDAKLIASAHVDNIIRIWDVRGDNSSLELIGHTGLIDCVQFTSNGKYIVSASHDNTIRFWDINSGKCTKIIEDQYQFRSSKVTVSADGKYIAYGRGDSGITLFNTCDELSIELYYHHDNVTSVCFSPDGKYLVSGSTDECLCIWNMDSYECIHKIEGHSDQITSISFSLDGDYMLSSSNNNIYVWETNSWQCIKVFNIQSERALISSRSNHIISVLDNYIYLYDFMPLQILISDIKKKFKDFPLTKTERSQNYL